MDQGMLAILGVAAVAGLLASLSLLRQMRKPEESPFAASTEGQKRCPNCGLGNNSLDRTCAACGQVLPG